MDSERKSDIAGIVRRYQKNYCGHKTELFLDNLSNQELDNLKNHKQDTDEYLLTIKETKQIKSKL